MSAAVIQNCPIGTMSTVIENLERQQLRRLPNFRAGDRVRIHIQVIEGTRKRTQIFEGVVIARGGHGVRETITVRKQSFGVGVERVFPLHSPKIEKIEVAARGDVRRAKLYYLRDRVGRKARVRERRDLTPDEAIERELLAAPPADEPELESAEGSDPAAGEAAEGGTAEVVEQVESEEAPAVEAAAAEAVAEEAPAADGEPADDAADDAPAGEPAAEAEAEPEAETPAEEK